MLQIKNMLGGGSLKINNSADKKYFSTEDLAYPMFVQKTTLGKQKYATNVGVSSKTSRPRIVKINDSIVLIIWYNSGAYKTLAETYNIDNGELIKLYSIDTGITNSPSNDIIAVAILPDNKIVLSIYNSTSQHQVNIFSVNDITGEITVVYSGYVSFDKNIPRLASGYYNDDFVYYTYGDSSNGSTTMYVGKYKPDSSGLTKISETAITSSLYNYNASGGNTSMYINGLIVLQSLYKYAINPLTGELIKSFTNSNDNSYLCLSSLLKTQFHIYRYADIGDNKYIVPASLVSNTIHFFIVTITDSTIVFSDPVIYATSNKVTSHPYSTMQNNKIKNLFAVTYGNSGSTEYASYCLLAEYKDGNIVVTNDSIKEEYDTGSGLCAIDYDFDCLTFLSYMITSSYVSDSNIEFVGRYNETIHKAVDSVYGFTYKPVNAGELALVCTFTNEEG